MTIKQALDATQIHPDADNFQIDGADAASVCFIGQVRNISSQSTNVTYKIDDGTGEIEAKQWSISTGAGAAGDDSMDTDDSSKPAVELNAYAKVFGKLKFFGNRRYVNAHCVRPVTDLNELHYHLLEATAIHLFFTRGPPGGGASAKGGAAAGGGGGAGGMDDYGAAGGSRPLPAMTPAARRVFNLLKSEPQTNEGLHVQMIAARLNMPVPEVTRAGDELLTAGLIFSTVDEATWAILEY